MLIMLNSPMAGARIVLIVCTAQLANSATAGLLRGARFPGERPGFEPWGLKPLGEFKVLLSRKMRAKILDAAPVPGPGSHVRGTQEAGRFPLVYVTAKGIIQTNATVRI